MKKTTAIVAWLVLWAGIAYAQDPRETEKWKTFFQKVDFSTALDVQKHSYEDGRFYPGLIVFIHPDSVARECEIRFSDFAAFSDPKKKLEIRGNKSFKKAEIYSFVFDGNLFMRESYKKFALGDASWARVVINGPLRALESYRIMDSYSGRRYFISRPISKYNDYANVSIESASIGFCKTAEKIMSESKEIVAKICAKEDGYRPKDFMKIIQEFNEHIRTTDPERYAKTIAPYYYFEGN